MEIENLRNKLRKFASERQWDQFHSPKNLSMALSAEVGELLEHFQWLKEEESFNPKDKKGVEEELADVFLYLIRLSDKLNIDLYESALSKIIINEQKYPKDLCKGRSDKYHEYTKEK